MTMMSIFQLPDDISVLGGANRVTPDFSTARRVTLTEIKEIAETIPKGWLWYPNFRFDTRAAALTYMKAEESADRRDPPPETKVIKRGGSADPHYLVVEKLSEE